MSFQDLYYILATALLVIGVVGTPLAMYWRSVMQRIDSLESKDTVSEDKVRRIVSDKLDPVRDDIIDVQNKLDKILDHLLDK